jgi:hypothetical protein
VRNKILFVAIVLVVGGLLVFGIVDHVSALGWVRNIFFRARGAASQVSVNTGKTGNLANAKMCRDNLGRIQAGKRKAAFDRSQNVGAVSWEDTLKAMNALPAGRLTDQVINAAIPKCPEGGQYSLGDLLQVSRCSIGGNNSLDLDDDHIIRD